MFFKEEKIEMQSYDIYIELFIGIINQIIILDSKYLENHNIEQKKKINTKINEYLKMLIILFEDTRTNEYINVEIPIGITGLPTIQTSSNNDDISDYVNPITIIINKIKSNKIKYYIILKWIENNGLIGNLSNEYIIKKDLIYFLYELEKNLYEIDKNIIRQYKSRLYDLLNKEQKIKLHSFSVFSLIKNDIEKITFETMSMIKKYYELEINLNLFTTSQIKKIYKIIELSIYNIKDNDIRPENIVEYENFINTYNNILNYTPTEISQKINDYKKIYYLTNLNLLLEKQNLITDRKKITEYCDFLKKINYNFTPEQKNKLKTLHTKLFFKNKINYKFDYDTWSPIFTYEELDLLKKNILNNLDNLCEIIKKLYPLYTISYDIFCDINPKNNEKKYKDSNQINKNVYLYCVVLIIVGILNFKLKENEQEYQLILKGGKALQFILSDMNINTNTNTNTIKSNDIDLIISTKNAKTYDPNKCKIFASEICLLIEWILNSSTNPYLKNNYVIHKIGLHYTDIIKLSYKIQDSDTNSNESRFNAIADLDFGKKNEIFYSNLIEKEQKSLFGELIYLYQNFDNYLLEKIYYLNLNIDTLDELNQLENLNKDKQLQKKNIERIINKFIIQIYKSTEIILSTNITPDNTNSILQRQHKYLTEIITNNKEKISFNRKKSKKIVDELFTPLDI